MKKSKELKSYEICWHKGKNDYSTTVYAYDLEEALEMFGCMGDECHLDTIEETNNFGM